MADPATETRFLPALDAADLPEGEGRQLVIDGRSVSVFRHEGRVHAMDGICPHAGAPLGPGVVWDGMVACPWHGWRFRFCDGTSPDMAGVAQTVYPVIEEGGRILVGIPAGPAPGPDPDGAPDAA